MNIANRLAQCSSLGKVFKLTSFTHEIGQIIMIIVKIIIIITH